MITCSGRPQSHDDFDALLDGEDAQAPLVEKLADEGEMAQRLKDLKEQIKDAKVDW